MKKKYLYIIIAVVALVIIGLLVGGYMTWRYFEEKEEKEERKERREEEEEEEKVSQPPEEDSQSSDNIGVKLSPKLDERDEPDDVDFQYMYFDELNIAAGQTWNKNTQLKFCVRYKSNVASPAYRTAILTGNSPLANGRTIQIDLWEYDKDYYCDSWEIAGGGRDYRILVPLNGSSSNKDIFHEVCIDDINSLLDNCVSEWGVDKNDAYLTDIYKAYVASPEVSSDDYSIFDYYRVFVNGVQVPESVFPNQNFNEFSGTIDDGQPDDFVGWAERDEAYAVSVE